MQCQICGANQATVHLTDIKAGQKHEVHLCEECAQNKKLKGQANLQEILAALAPKATKELSHLSKLKCPTCGISFLEFRHGGRFGCPDDYEAFGKELEPLLEKIHHLQKLHQGHVQHVGRVPTQAGAAATRESELVRLTMDLNRAVEREDYEKAAEIRDRIAKVKGEKTG